MSLTEICGQFIQNATCYCLSLSGNWSDHPLFQVQSVLLCAFEKPETNPPSTLKSQKGISPHTFSQCVMGLICPYRCFCRSPSLCQFPATTTFPPLFNSLLATETNHLKSTLQLGYSQASNTFLPTPIPLKLISPPLCIPSSSHV